MTLGMKRCVATVVPLFMMTVLGSKTAVAGPQAEVRIRPEATLFACLTNYRKAVDDYRSGNRSAATNAVGQLNVKELRLVVGALVAARKTPSKFASPVQRTQDQFAPLLRWDSAALTAAGVLHLEMARREGDDGRADGVAFHQGMAAVIFTALATPLAGESDSEKRRSALTVGWFLLLERKLQVAQQHLESAARQWPRDAAVQLAYGTVLETECTGPYPVLPPEQLVPPPPPPRSRIERPDVNPYSRERSARVSILRDSERALAVAADVDPASVEARVRLAHVRALEHKDADAITLLDDVLRGSSPREWKYTASLILGAVYEHAGQHDRARAAYEDALQLEPGSQPASIALSHLAYSIDQREAAVAALDSFFAASGVSIHRRDPWWDYPLGLRTAVDALFEKLRSQVRD